MTEVSIRALQTHAVEIVERARRGEPLTITRAGRPVARLTAVGPLPARLEKLVHRRAPLPGVDPDQLRRDVDSPG